jgi:hypothetical protein
LVHPFGRLHMLALFWHILLFGLCGGARLTRCSRRNSPSPPARGSSSHVFAAANGRVSHVPS